MKPQPRIPLRAPRIRLRIPRTRRMRIVLVTAVAVPLIGAVTAELTARSFLDQRLSQAASRSLSGRLHVTTSGDLALFELLNKNIPQADLSSSDTRLGPLSHAAVNLHLNDVRMAGCAGTTVGSSKADVRLSATNLADLLASGASTVSGSGVTPDPAQGTIDFSLAGGLGQMTVKPVLNAGRVGFSVTGLTLLGQPAPQNMTDQFGGRFSQFGAKGTYPLGLRATSVSVTSAGVAATFEGGKTVFKPKSPPNSAPTPTVNAPTVKAPTRGPAPSKV
jgi:hypothetical protein